MLFETALKEANGEITEMIAIDTTQMNNSTKIPRLVIDTIQTIGVANRQGVNGTLSGAAIVKIRATKSRNIENTNINQYNNARNNSSGNSRNPLRADEPQAGPRIHPVNVMEIQEMEPKERNT